MTLETVCYARAGLIGNPSDGYFGKTISVILRNFRARVRIEESEILRIEASDEDRPEYRSLGHLGDSIRERGYYGGLRLVKAACKRFGDYCRGNAIELPRRNFLLRYESNIPLRVGLAGSSAIVTATFRALMQFYGVSIPKPVLPNLILACETEELGIGAGLQDRVIQVYEGVVYMNFAREIMERQGYGEYEELDPHSLPPLFVAYATRLSEGTEVFHNNIRERWNRGEEAVHRVMKNCAILAKQARDLIAAGRGDEIGPLMDRNFDERRSIYRLSDTNIELVERARALGASSKFAGSGGAVIGTCTDEETYRKLERSYAEMDAKIFRPQILPGE